MWSVYKTHGMTLFQEQITERVERCMDKKERLTMGEVEILRRFLSDVGHRNSLSFVEEQELVHIEKKLGL